MKNRIRNTLIVKLLVPTIVTLIATGAIADDGDAELDAIREKVASMFDLIDPENINRSPVDGWYTVQKGSIVAYISDDGRYLLQGDLIDLDEQVNLSELTRNDARREMMATVTDAQTILFSPAKVKYRISVFTDVECGYCRRLHNQIDEYLAHGIEVRYLLYPRNGPASRAWNTSEDVWCSADRNDALTKAKLDKDFPTATCDSSAVQDHFVLGRDVGLSGTPAIVLDDGTLISGYLPPDQLKARLDQLDGAQP